MNYHNTIMIIVLTVPFLGHAAEQKKKISELSDTQQIAAYCTIINRLPEDLSRYVQKHFSNKYGCIKTMRQNNEIHTLITLSDGTLAANGISTIMQTGLNSSASIINIWCPLSGKRIKLTAPVNTQLFTALTNGRFASAADDGGGIEIWEPSSSRAWDLSSGRHVKTLSGHAGDTTALAVLSNGSPVSGGYDGTIKVWGVSSDHYFSMSTAPSDRDGTISRFDPSSGQMVITYSGPENRVHALADLGNGSLAAAQDDGISIWNLASGQLTKKIVECTSGDHIRALAALPGKKLAFAQGRTIKIWNLNSNQCEATFTASKTYIHALAALRDSTFASADHNGTIKVWQKEDHSSYALYCASLYKRDNNRNSSNPNNCAIQ